MPKPWYIGCDLSLDRSGNRCKPFLFRVRILRQTHLQPHIVRDLLNRVMKAGDVVGVTECLAFAIEAI
jgi:hypothetical protein